MMYPTEEHFPTFQLLRKSYQYTELGIYNNEKHLNSKFSAEESQE